MSNQEHVGYRYLSWAYYVEPGLTANQKAHGNDTFAAEFESLPPMLEPYEGWGETMAYLCRRSACRHRGETVDEWVPRWERQRGVRGLLDAENDGGAEGDDAEEDEGGGGQGAGGGDG